MLRKKTSVISKEEEEEEKEENAAKEEEKRFEFHDDFEEFTGWRDCGKGIVIQSEDFKYSGKFS